MARDLYEIVGNKLKFYLHPGQTKAWRCESRIILVLAGTQGGKTTFGPLWLHREIQRTANGHNDDYIAATSSYDLFKLKMLPEMKRYFCDCLGWAYNAGDKTIVSPDGARIILRSAQAEGGLESSTAKAAWLDEWGQDCVSVEAWEAVQRRLSINQGRVLFTTTPYNLGWLKVQVYDRWVGGDKDYAVIQFKSTDNPNFPMEEYNRAKRTLPYWKFEMFYNGVFTRPAGLIYTDYNDSYAQFDDSGAWSGGGITAIDVVGKASSTADVQLSATLYVDSTAQTLVASTSGTAASYRQGSDAAHPVKVGFDVPADVVSVVLAAGADGPNWTDKTVTVKYRRLS